MYYWKDLVPLAGEDLFFDVVITVSIITKTISLSNKKMFDSSVMIYITALRKK